MEFMCLSQNQIVFFVFFFEGKKIIITNSYEKKEDKMSIMDYNKAKKLRNDYITRCQKGTYYEKSNTKKNNR